MADLFVMFKKVKKQGKCGACWAFSAIASIESDIFINTGELVDLSVQVRISSLNIIASSIPCDKYGGKV